MRRDRDHFQKEPFGRYFLPGLLASMGSQVAAERCVWKREKMRDMGKINFERLVDWVEGRLSEEESRVVEEQVAVADEETRAQVEWLHAFARVSEDVVIDSLPQEVREELIRRFDAYAEDRRIPSLLQRLVATLSFDSGLQPAFGARSAAGPEEQRQLVYTTDAADIALNLRPRPRNGHLDLHGQIFPADDADPGSFSVQLLSGSDEVGLTTTDELGEFAFESVSPDAYQILVSGQRVEILISSVELRL